jgi:alkanesulfonate monooxygenase SsuD/methylene tetrahydromethanopterin reductase-like flavin-dependent oxidoreductase (luciferase family)
MSSTMIGITLPTSAPGNLVMHPEDVGTTAEWAEKAGFDALWVGDHIFHPMQFMEALICLTFGAARTKTIRIGTSVLLLPMRQLSIVASQIATLQNLSGGRLHLGLGVGGEWPKEWIGAGVPLKERGARFDEMVPLLRRLLAGDNIDFNGRFNTLPGVDLRPVAPRVPFYFSGRVPAALDRSAKFGDGWIGFFLTLNGFKRDTALIDAARERFGTADKPFRRGMMLNFFFDKNDDGADLRAAQLQSSAFPPELRLTPIEKLRRFVIAGTPARVAEQMQDFIDAGCEIFSLSPIARGQTAKEHLEMLASEVLPKLERVRTDHRSLH